MKTEEIIRDVQRNGGSVAAFSIDDLDEMFSFALSLVRHGYSAPAIACLPALCGINTNAIDRVVIVNVWSKVGGDA